jgi:uncharacterized protein YbbC (DUF1343 family)
VSLYGTQAKPSRADLRGLDAIVFDLQDAGVRFYTYMSTLLLCREAAAEAGIELVVLDRPNPLGGERTEGPARDRRRKADILSLAPGPLVHGLTTGEMARWANAHAGRPAHLEVVPMHGWRRAMTWADTGRGFVPPSPNLRSPEAALAYPGVCLLEATNVSEGRGTDAPFLLFGAPWMDAPGLAAALSVPGFALAPVRFVPEASPAAPEPKYRSEDCAGLRVAVTDASAASPYRLGLELLAGLRAREPHFRLRDGGAALDRLLGTARVRGSLLRGRSAASVLAEDEAAVRAWRDSRREVLLYD